MHYHIISLFPEMFESYISESLFARAILKKIIKVSILNPRDFTSDKHRKADDRPYAGGPGMVLYAEPILRSVELVLRKLRIKNYKLKIGKTKKKSPKSSVKIIILSPGGKQFTNTLARQWAKKYKDIILISGRYEGIDARVKKILKAEEISIGDYVLTGGELPAMVVMDAVCRQLPGFLGKSESLEENRISSHEVYTRPEKLVYKGKSYKVPKVLLSGNHKKIEDWKKKKQ